MDEGSAWLFFGHRYVDEHHRPQPLKVFYGEGGDAPPVPADDELAAGVEATPVAGIRVAVQPLLSLGVVTIWKQVSGCESEVQALDAKRRAAEDQASLEAAVRSWGLDWERVGRITTLLAVRVDTDDLDELVASNAVDLGRLWTGNIEDERPEHLAAYATDENISRRRFERIYLRWSDALVVYDRTTEQAAPASMRVAQLVETGILMRRLLREAAFETETVMRSIRPWTLPWLSRSLKQAEHLRQILADAELMTSVAPPTHSIEGERLLARTLEAFDIPKLQATVGYALGELDRRLAWQRVKWLAGIAVLAFLVNTTISLFG